VLQTVATGSKFGYKGKWAIGQTPERIGFYFIDRFLSRLRFSLESLLGSTQKCFYWHSLLDVFILLFSALEILPEPQD
jgi:hypothetical protein